MSKQGGSANAAAEEVDSESEGVWAAMETDCESVASLYSMPDLQSVLSTDSSSPSEDEGMIDDASNDAGWFSEVEDDAHSLDDNVWTSGEDKPKHSFINISWDEQLTPLEANAPYLLENCEPSIPAFAGEDASLVASDKPTPKRHGLYSYIKTELYDSGCTQYISPYRVDFETFEDITPKSFKAANKQSFSAIGKGKMVINVPDSADISQLRLTEVLYSPEVGYTLVSIGKLDDLSFEIRFKDGKCTIEGPNGKRIGAVPKVGKGLYRHQHEQDKAQVAAETLTLDQFHHYMGHISPEIA